MTAGRGMTELWMGFSILQQAAEAGDYELFFSWSGAGQVATSVSFSLFSKDIALISEGLVRIKQDEDYVALSSLTLWIEH